MTDTINDTIVKLQAALATAQLVAAPPPPPPTISNMTATPSSLPVGGGTVVVDAIVTGATALTLTLDGVSIPIPAGLPVTVTVPG